MPLTSDYTRLWRRQRKRYVYENALPQREQQAIATTRRPTLVFDQSNINVDERRAAGYGLLFCVHGRLLTQPCTSKTCRRNAREARANATKLAQRIRAVVLQGWEVT